MKKLKKRLVSLFVVCIVLTYWKQGFVFAEVGTVVGGRITTDTIWTKDHSPYRVNSNIGIDDGVNLTIEKGVTVLFNENTRIYADDGKLTVNGSPDEKVVFQFAQTSNDRNEEISIGSDSHLANFEVYDARVGLSIYGQNNKIENGTINNSTFNGIYVLGKNNDILNSKLNSNRTGIMLFGNDNHFIGNEIQSSLEDGINLQNSTKNIFINNEIEKSQKYAVFSEAPYWSLVNYFYHNTFSENKLGINTSTANVFSRNNIYDLVNIINSDLYTMDLSQNYWGTTVESEINQRITLPNSDFNVNITPYLTESSGLVEKVIPNAPVLNSIKDNDQFITGKAEPSKKVTIIQKYTDWERKIDVIADENGDFLTSFTKVPAGEKVEAFVTNEYGLKSSEVYTTVLDGTSPSPPILEEVSNKSTMIKGTGEKGSKVLVKNSEQIIGEGVIGEDSKFEINIPIQKEGTILTITLIDSSENSSEPLTIIIKDRIAPEKPTFEPITTSSTSLTGTSEPGTIVRLYSQYENSIKEVKTDDTGKFSFNIVQYPLGTKLILNTIDNEENRSEEAVIYVGIDAPLVEEYSDSSSILKGKTVSNATVWISGESYFQSVEANDLGLFEATLGKQKAGSMITIKVFKTGFSNETTIFVADKTAPQIPNPTTLTDQTKEIIGVAEPNSTVTVKANGILLGSDVTGSDYFFNIPIAPQKAGVTLELQATDKAGNVSEVHLMTVTDVTPPSQPVVNTVTNKSFEVSGKSEVNSVVTVNLGEKNLITTTDQNGYYKISIPVQNAGTSFTISAKDNSQNSSTPKTIVVKRVAPNIPTVNIVDNKMTTVGGKAEVASVVTVSIAGKNYSAKTDAYGNYKVAIPVQNSGITISINAKDSAGNSSVAKTTVVKRIAPNLPTANTVNNKTTYVSGKAEVNAIVTLTIGTRSYYGKADQYGNFKITIPVQNSGMIISITAKDSAGKVSAVRKVTVLRVAPNIPTVNTVKYNSTTLSGKTERYAIVTIKISTKTYTVKASSSGYFKAYIPKQKVGTKIYVTAKDTKGNVSVVRTVSVVK
ncbi:Ig-like domain-containing protein [Bacillus sp. AFS041924]|uniref:Ig-like domain-containing protein n=1 Tax=Bacillus sp. AFS041924 TaxID=2033503 RepID=UPI000BFB15F9|nr:Ig-like domain-containing protein [Bacillus sp. AFS041924]PGS54255.1 hypothetical protein COC46_05990 [Bacillus sp. AFS041924]